jgi:hypothetical protein
MVMTVKQVESMVAEMKEDFKQSPCCDEALHRRQDEIYVAVLEAISSGECEPPAECAFAALAIEEIPFSRWYA